MTCLRIAFENWVNNEPGELESDRPTEEELLEFEEAEKQHAELVSIRIFEVCLAMIVSHWDFFEVSFNGTAGC